MSEQGEKRAHRDARIIEVLLGAVLAVAVAYAGWTVNKFIELETRITRLETKVAEFEARFSRIEERLTRIEAALNFLVARKKAEDGIEDASADTGDSKQSRLAPGQSKLSTEQGQLATR